MGISPDRLIATAASPQLIPTFDDYIERVSKAVSHGTLRVYASYWNKVREAWGTRPITEPTPLEIRQLAETVKEKRTIRRNSRGGRSAAEHLISALRCLYRHAVADGLISDHDNPSKRVPKPRRQTSIRHALSDAQLRSINEVAITTGNDPDLDGLLLRFHEETACRRGGALALSRADLDTDQCVVALREKGDTLRWQPISPTLSARLSELAGERGGVNPADRLFRYRSGKPITHRRYDHLWQRIGRHLPWVRVQQISTHWLRHTTLTWVERNFGYAVARAFAGHQGRSDAGTTITYVRADIYDIAQALSALTGENHPLAWQALDETARKPTPPA
ncbi:site-specific integrase [Micromonospora sp. C51]|nr:site-specific integrase [Micromonospora sp. C51]